MQGQVFRIDAKVGKAVGESIIMHARNIIEKIFDAHVVYQNQGHPAILAVDLMLIHEVTSAQAFDSLRDKSLTPYAPERLRATLDHSIPTRSDRFNILDESARIQVDTLRNNASEFGIRIYDFDSGNQGIVHVIGPELGATQPGMTIVCGDSHTSTHGAFGALAFGIGTTEVGHVLATSCLLRTRPKTMKVEFTGALRPGVFSKDAILKLIAEIGIGGATGHVIEYCGEAVRSWTMEERMTVCNMSIECGARAGLIAPDEVTIEYLRGRRFAPAGEAFEAATKKWMNIRSDPGASYDKHITIDLSTLLPMVTWGTNPSQGTAINENIPAPSNSSESAALKYTQLNSGDPIQGTPIQWAFVGSCTNGRLSDLRIAAKILQGKKVHHAVTFYIVPGSEQVAAQAEAEGLPEIFREAGAIWRMPGCSMCLGMNDDKVPAGQRCISTSNRNFVGRQGTGSITHLASPATVAASAIAGQIRSPAAYFAD